MADLKRINSLTEDKARAEFLRCCGSAAWAERMVRARPFKDEAHLQGEAEKIWYGLAHSDWREAFAQHYKIGDKKVIKDKVGAAEQSGVKSAKEDVLRAIAEGNELYEMKFGYIFIICATGKSADSMLADLRKRLDNDRQSELIIAAEEQRKITKLRLEKL